MYEYFQPNTKDKNNKYGDCTIRAFAKATGKSWLEAYDTLQPFERQEQCPINGFTQAQYKKVYANFGFMWHGEKAELGSSRITVSEFSDSHKYGTYILSVAHHHVTVVDGKYFDSWDCGKKSIYGWYEKVVQMF